MKKVRQGVLLKLVMAAFMIYASLQITDLQIQIAQKRRLIAEYEAKNAELEIKNQTLTNELEKGLSDEQVARIAQEKLGLHDADETVFVAIPG